MKRPWYAQTSVDAIECRNPNENDTQCEHAKRPFEVGAKWMNRDNCTLWILNEKKDGLAQWVLVSMKLRE